MAKLTLKKLIEKLNKEKFDGNVYIGGSDGSGFFYIGPYNKDKIQKIYDQLDKGIRAIGDADTKELHTNLKKGFASRIELELEQDKRIFDDEKKNVDLNDQLSDEKKAELIAKLRKRFIRSDLDIELQIVRELNTLSSRIKKVENYKKNYKPNVEDVAVAEYYDKTDPKEPGKIILLEGCQKGKYWLASEVKD